MFHQYAFFPDNKYNSKTSFANQLSNPDAIYNLQDKFDK